MVLPDESRSREELSDLVAAQQLLIDELTRRLCERDENLHEFEIPRGSRSGGPTITTHDRDPDQVVTHSSDRCGSGGADLGSAEVVRTERRRVLELSEFHLRITDHVLERRVCPSGHETDGEAAGVASQLLSYGPGVRSFAAYLALRQHLPIDQATEILSDALGHDFTVGEVAQLVSEV